MCAQIDLPGAGEIGLVADTYGDPQGQPVVLLHGGGQTRHAWGGTGEGLANAGFYTISVDQRGHGDSAWADDGDYHIDAFAADLDALAADLHPRPAVVGASLGGMAALLAQAIYPNLLSTLVLVDIAPRIEAAGVTRILNFMTARPNGFASIEAAADAIAEYLPHRPRPKDLSGLAKNLRRGDDGRYRWHWDPRFITPDHSRASATTQGRLTEAARKLTAPTLLVRGGLSDVLSEEAAREFIELAPHAEYVDVGNAAHMIAGDRNDRFTATVGEFLARVY